MKIIQFLHVLHRRVSVLQATFDLSLVEVLHETGFQLPIMLLKAFVLENEAENHQGKNCNDESRYIPIKFYRKEKENECKHVSYRYHCGQEVAIVMIGCPKRKNKKGLFASVLYYTYNKRRHYRHTET